MSIVDTKILSKYLIRIVNYLSSYLSEVLHSLVKFQVIAFMGVNAVTEVFF